MASREGSKADMFHIDKVGHHKDSADHSMDLAPRSVVLALHNREEALHNMGMAPHKDLHTVQVEDKALHSVPLEDCTRGSQSPPCIEVCWWGGNVASLGTQVLHKGHRTPH